MMTVFATSSAALRALRTRLVLLVVSVGLLAAATSVVTAHDAHAAGPTGTASTTVNASVTQVISISANQSTISLNGAPSTTAGPVTAGFTVVTNDTSGYSVTLKANSATMVGTGANPDTIPIANLQATAVGGSTYTGLSNTATTTLFTKASASAVTGDSNNFSLQLAIPFVRADTYTVGLTYTATGA